MSIHLRLTVQNRHGVLDRISGLIRRNGLNINEVNVGERIDGTSCINLQMRDKNADVHILSKALTDLDCVQSCEECTDETHLIRELLLFSMKSSDYSEDTFPGVQLVEKDGERLNLSYLAAPSEIDSLLQKHGDTMCDYSRCGALGLKRKEVNADD